LDALNHEIMVLDFGDDDGAAGQNAARRHFVNLRFLERRSSKQGIPAPAISVAFAPFCDKSLS
jgi:hypothetical protein